MVSQLISNVVKRIILVLILMVLLASLFLFKKSALERRWEGGERLSFLIIGLEEREKPQSLKDILLVNYQPETKRLSLLAIPMNTLIPDNTRIKSLYRQNLQGNDLRKGCLSVKDAIEKFLNLEIPFYLVFDEEGFIKAVDLLGGIEVEVDQMLGGARHQTVLGGEESLAYLKFEEPRFGEFGKFSRWQRFVWALIQRFNDSSLDPKLVRELLKNSLLTNLKVRDILDWLKEAENIRETGIEVSKIPGRTIYKDWMNCWEVDTLALSQLFQKLNRELGEEEGAGRIP